MANYDPADIGPSPPDPSDQRNADVTEYYAQHGAPASTDYQQDAPPNSRDLGMTAQEAYNFVPPPDPYAFLGQEDSKQSSGLFSGLGTAARAATVAIGSGLEAAN